MTRIVIGETSTGRRIVTVPVTDAKWTQELNAAGSISCTVPLYDRRARKIGMRAAATTLKSFLGYEENGVFMNGGPIWKHNYDEDKGSLDIDASGIWSYLDSRTVNSSTAPTLGLLDSKGKPLAATTYVLNNLSNATIIKRIIQLVRGWANAAFPIVLPVDEAQPGNEYTAIGADLKSAGDAIYDITQYVDGPDVMFDMEYSSDDANIVQWRMRAGTIDKRTLSGKLSFRWDASVSRRSIRSIKVALDGTNQATTVWTTGGRSGDKALYDVRTNNAAINAGFPAVEFVDGSHTDVVRQSTLAKYGAETLRNSAMPTEYWTFEVRNDRAPLIGSYKVGDYCDIVIGEDDPYIAAGTYRRRILTLSGNIKSKWTSVTTGEVLSDNG